MIDILEIWQLLEINPAVFLNWKKVFQKVRNPLPREVYNKCKDKSTFVQNTKIKELRVEITFETLSSVRIKEY